MDNKYRQEKHRKEKSKDFTKEKRKRKYEEGNDSLTHPPQKIRKESTVVEQSISNSMEKEEFKIPELFLQFFNKVNFKEPRNIQLKCWPLLLEQKNVIAEAETGSGKTLSFLLPFIELHKNKKIKKAIVFSPTRELSTQIFTVVRQISKIYPMKSILICGGKDREKQIEKLESEYDIIIGTVGRICDMIQEEKIKMDVINYCVLDEADKMLDMGFKEQILLILSLLSSDAQIGLFSATLSGIDEEIKNKYIKNAISISVKQNKYDINRNVEQIVQVCAEHKKPRKLIKFLEKLREDEKDKRQKSIILIIVNQIKKMHFLTKFLKENCLPRKNSRFNSDSQLPTKSDKKKLIDNIESAVLHSKMTQKERDLALQNFKCGKVPILIATDIAGRGLDIKNLNYIINYDFPSNLDQYIHRIGRCGRGNIKGTAISYFTRNYSALAPDLVDLLKSCDQKIDQYLFELCDNQNRINAVDHLDEMKDEVKEGGDDDKEEEEGECDDDEEEEEEKVKERKSHKILIK